ncbi:hypothetical protein XELAEV_18012859mg [Xenopus laevis]|uniref:Uncharacterized protein n=1 Tax=Xenopus laevis TaxID=8355 RepID=A0A974DPR8_XENLA|nr:hypothetical protein XELAEV_18012859mg [Xenopus laevis]
MTAEPCLKVTELSLHMRLFTRTPQVQKLHFLLLTNPIITQPPSTHTKVRVLPPHMSPQTLHLPLLPLCGSVTDHLSLHKAAPSSLRQPHTSLCPPHPPLPPCEYNTLSSQHTHRAKHSPPSSQPLHIRNFSVHTYCHTKSHQNNSPLLTRWPSPVLQSSVYAN